MAFGPRGRACQAQRRGSSPEFPRRRLFCCERGGPLQGLGARQSRVQRCSRARGRPPQEQP
eukprot:11166441-Lingulodinium_polyedra.AAC.1